MKEEEDCRKALTMPELGALVVDAAALVSWDRFPVLRWRPNRDFRFKAGACVSRLIVGPQLGKPPAAFSSLNFLASAASAASPSASPSASRPPSPPFSSSSSLGL